MYTVTVDGTDFSRKVLYRKLAFKLRRRIEKRFPDAIVRVFCKGIGNSQPLAARGVYGLGTVP